MILVEKKYNKLISFIFNIDIYGFKICSTSWINSKHNIYNSLRQLELRLLHNDNIVWKKKYLLKLNFIIKFGTIYYDELDDAFV